MSKILEGNPCYRSDVVLAVVSSLSCVLCKVKKILKSELTMEVGGWVQVSLRIFFGGKSQNSPKPGSIPRQMSRCVLPNYPDEQIQNLSFLLQIVLQLKLFS